MNTADILKAAKAKIANPANWMQGFYARDINGNELIGNEPGAVCFCAIGAIESVQGIEHHGNGWAERPVELLCEAANQQIAIYNDGHTHEEVLAVYDKAIAAAEKESA